MARLKVTSPMLELDEGQTVYYSRNNETRECVYTHGGIIRMYDDEGEPIGFIPEGFFTTKGPEREIVRVHPKYVSTIHQNNTLV